jgi:hypothetical protein
MASKDQDTRDVGCEYGYFSRRFPLECCLIAYYSTRQDRNPSIPSNQRNQNAPSQRIHT